MSIKIGIDACFTDHVFDGGKDMFLFNLLAGFEQLGKGKMITVFCLENTTEIFRKYIPSACFVTVPIKSYTGKIIVDKAISRTVFYCKMIKKLGIDVLFFAKSYTTFLPCPCKTVIIPHDIQIISHGERFTKAQRRKEKIFMFLDFMLRNKIIAVSDFDAGEMKLYYPWVKNKIKRLYLPVKINLAKKKTVVEPYIIGVNIVYEHKNTITLIKAFERIKAKIPHKLYLVGRTRGYSATLIEYVKKRNLADRIIFTGYISDQELSSLLANAALYVNPSLFEGFGITAVEAMIQEVPTLVADVAANKETTKGLCKYYTNPLDDEELGRKILETLDDEEYRKNLKKIGNSIYESYNYLRITKEYYKMFFELVNGKLPEGAEL